MVYTFLYLTLHFLRSIFDMLSLVLEFEESVEHPELYFDKTHTCIVLECLFSQKDPIRIHRYH